MACSTTMLALQTPEPSAVFRRTLAGEHHHEVSSHLPCRTSHAAPAVPAFADIAHGREDKDL